jgi:predicted Zn finger-like uncharacterized protein
MILTCPSCATSYFTPDEAIGPNGRKVRCKTCAHVWHASLSDEPLELNAPPEAAVSGTVAGATRPEAKTGFGKRDEAGESLAETPAPELPKAFRARAEEQRRVRRAATHGAVWAGLASVFVAILAAGWLFRVEVVELYPRAAAAYAAVGSPVNPIGLQFEAVGAKALINDPNKVVVSGALRNVRDREVVAPSVRVALLDAHGAEIGHSVVNIDAAPVLPGGVQGFAVVIADPGAKGAGVDVGFVEAPKATSRSARETVDHHPAPDHGDGHAPAANPRIPPQAEGAGPAADPAAPASANGLRPAVSHEVNPPSALTPVDARPIDIGHGEAVSASHHG